MLRLIAISLVTMTLFVAPVLAATKVTVNGVPISDVQISQRVKLMALEGGGDLKKAQQQLIDDQLKIQEGKRIGVDITERQIDGAFNNVARNVKLSTDKLRQILSARGVNVDTMRLRLKAALAWQAVQESIVKARVDLSEAELDKEASAALKQDQSFDYIVTEVLFISAGKSGAGRSGDANRFRSQFKGCESAVDLSLKFTDVAVRSIGRRHATQLPDALAAELAKLPVGGISKPRAVDGGLSMLAICEKESARDLTFIKNKLRNEQGNEAMKGEADKYLEELRKKATIVYG
jgi:peptidyl-prolyl cis-trans isomerase SurA